MAEKKEPKQWYFIVWEERHPTRPFGVEIYNDVTDEHPLDFLIEARKASRHKVNLLFWSVLDESGGWVSSWKKKLDGK